MDHTAGSQPSDGLAKFVSRKCLAVECLSNSFDFETGWSKVQAISVEWAASRTFLSRDPSQREGCLPAFFA